ncbi:hypothetical protein LV89_04483 [Arcicella aurantiaca]|uniref:Lumazine-binding protein n=1 Tax=Arcicella aurantiaca TaxID=591202 RepID=A0A316DFX7_9BACT|nr:hypothetical protein [Arcicella aurantiaca]PWK17197.1 hypothetical protein LV89_04483 [Arcicella aurantiaca]
MKRLLKIFPLFLILPSLFLYSLIGGKKSALPNQKGIKESATEIFKNANKIVNKDTIYDFRIHLSRAFNQQIRATPLYLNLMLNQATRNGQIKDTQIVSENKIKKDSSILIVKIWFNTDSLQFEQPMVYQDGWKIGVNYTKERNRLLSKKQ